ncbi:outer spore coat protein CotE [Wukongibacter baidiensis]|uniref:outer spore coat protein CotE n=1 Tax=Wukongibacter baidiensis TaxID=1723361 RepID=UPI003D7F9937
MSDNNSYNGDMRTILTKTLFGRATQTCQNTVYISPEEDIEPKQVLGCFITDAEIHSAKLENFTHEYINLRIEGKFKVHLWYYTNRNTAVSKGDTEFSQIINLKNLEGKAHFKKNDIIKNVKTWINKTPVCLGTMIVNRAGVPTIAAQLEYELAAEVFEESKIDVLDRGHKKKKEYKEVAYDSDTTFFDKFFNESDDVNYDDCD